MEIWKDINDYEGYQVSSYGRVRSLNYRRTGKTKVLSPGENTCGYLQVDLCKSGKEKTFLIHRLVAEAFLHNYFDYSDINHIDEDKHNNHVTNLEYCDRRYNNNYGTRIERMSKTVLQLTKTGELVREWPSTAEAGRNGFNHSNIIKCCSGERKSHKGFRWRYKEKKEVV